MPIFDNRYTGLAPTILVIIIVWAVAAVLMLTGTLVAARQIDTKVNEDITQSVPQIDQDLNNVKLAARTARIADRIEAAAVPLEGQLNTVIDEAKDIRETVGTRQAGEDGREDDILSVATTINNNVDRIFSRVRTIGGTVNGIHGGVLSIGGSVQSIRGSVVSIQGNARSILGTAQRIDITRCPTPERVEDERRRVGGNPVTGVCGVHGINTRLDIGINTVGGIHDDLENVLTEVGKPADVRGHVRQDQPTRATIHGHANSIDCQIDQLGKVTILGSGGITIDVIPTAPSQYCNI